MMERLADYVPAIGDGGYVAARPAQMTDARWRWIWRTHRPAIVAAGAAIVIGGRVYVHPARMDAVLVELGRAAAERRIADGAPPTVPAAPAVSAPPPTTRRRARRAATPSVVVLDGSSAADAAASAPHRGR